MFLFLDLIIFLFTSCVALVPILIVLGCVRNNNYKLKNKFLSLQPIVGKTYGHIVLTCGDPSSSVLMLDTRTGKQVRVCEWTNTNCRIVLVFDLDNYCIEISPSTNIN